jgi:hypothetical protein
MNTTWFLVGKQLVGLLAVFVRVGAIIYIDASVSYIRVGAIIDIDASVSYIRVGAIIYIRVGAIIYIDVSVSYIDASVREHALEVRHLERGVFVIVG